MNDFCSKLNGIYQHLALIDRRLDNLEKLKGKEKNYMDVIGMLKLQEEYSRFVYQDSLGVLTIGYGRNLRDVGISQEEALYLLNNDWEIAKKEVERISIYSKLNDVRQGVLQIMCLNMGLGALLGFRKMFSCLELDDYEGAAQGMLDSLWAREVGHRAEVLADLMKTGMIP